MTARVKPKTAHKRRGGDRAGPDAAGLAAAGVYSSGPRDTGAAAATTAAATTGPFRNAMRRRYDLFLRRLGAYLDCPGEEQLHDLRTSIRRLESTYDALPKSERPARSGKLMSAARRLFCRTGPLRDSDVISAMLIELGIAADSGAIARLRRGREDVFEDAVLRARKIAALRPLSGAAVDKIDRHKMASRRRRMIWSLFDDVRGISAIVSSDESRVEELHAMRKMVKRLRYLLEDEEQYRAYCRGASVAASGTGVGSSNAPRDYDVSLSDVLGAVRQVQESTGVIRDCDIAIQYVAANYAGLGDAASGIFDAIQRRRHKTYLALVGMHIRQDAMQPAP